MPERIGIGATIGIRVEGVDRIVFGGYEQDVVNLAITHPEAGHVERLSIDGAVDGKGE